MRATLFKLLFAIVCLLSSTNALANDYFEVDGIYYDVVSLDELTCEVIKNRSNDWYKGDIIIPETVNYNGRAFTVVKIAKDAFYSNGDITSVTIGNSVTSIDVWQFMRCRGLKSVTIGNAVTSIGIKAFEECVKLTSVTIGNSVISIGESAFRKCESLTNVLIPNSVTTIGRDAFRECSNLTSVTISNSVTSIEDGTFEDCKSLVDVVIPNSVISMGIAFSGCSSLTSFVIPNSVTSIGDGMFLWCSSLVSVTIGSSVTNIGKLAFYGCDALTELYSLNPIPPQVEYKYQSITNSTFTSTHYSTTHVYVPQEALEEYKNTTGWMFFSNLKGINATGINNVETENGNENVYYDLQGNRLNAPKRGVNIINGKKIFVK